MYHLLRRGAQHLLVALILVSADEFGSFWCQFIGVLQVYASVFDTWPPLQPKYVYCDLNLACRRPARRTRGPGWSLWASGRTARRLAAGLPASAGIGLVRRARGRQTVRVVSFKNRLKIYLFRRCYESAWRLHFPFLVIVSPLWNSGPCNSFDYLGHSKNVDDDDADDDEDWQLLMCPSEIRAQHSVAISWYTTP